MYHLSFICLLMRLSDALCVFPPTVIIITGGPIRVGVGVPGVAPYHRGSHRCRAQSRLALNERRQR